MQKSHATKQRGALLLSAIALIIVFAFVGIVIARILIATHGTTKASQDSSEAFFLADSGMQSAALRLFGLPLSQRLACSNITGDSDLTDVSVANRGVFTVTGTHRYTTSPSTLRLAITGTTSILPVVSTAAYADNGWVMIDREMIAYKGKTETDNALCTPYSAPCFYGITRAVGGSASDAHNAGTPVAQNMCQLVSSGGIPDLTTPTGKGVIHANAPLEEAWFVGGRNNADVQIIGRWDGQDWSRVTPAGIGDEEFFAVDALSYNDVWAVGRGSGSNNRIIHWNGNSWSSFTIPSPNRLLRGVTCLNGDDCWAVGSSRKFIHWDGSSWTNGNLDASIPNRNFYSVSCSSSNNCWAVGAQSSGALIAHWNGTIWSRVTSLFDNIPSQNLFGIKCTPNYCYAVGNDDSSSGKLNIIRCRLLSGVPSCVELGGTIIGSVPSLTRNLYAVTCTDDNHCWAVGQPSGGDLLIVRTTNSIDWTQFSMPSTPSRNLRAISCGNPNNCWAVGGANSNNVAAHWNGLTWNVFTLDASIPQHTLRGVTVIAPENPKLLNWEEQ